MLSIFKLFLSIVLISGLLVGGAVSIADYFSRRSTAGRIVESARTVGNVFRDKKNKIEFKYPSDASSSEKIMQPSTGPAFSIIEIMLADSTAGPYRMFSVSIDDRRPSGPKCADWYPELYHNAEAKNINRVVFYRTSNAESGCSLAQIDHDAPQQDVQCTSSKLVHYIAETTGRCYHVIEQVDKHAQADHDSNASTSDSSDDSQEFDILEQIMRTVTIGEEVDQ